MEQQRASELRVFADEELRRYFGEFSDDIRELRAIESLLALKVLLDSLDSPNWATLPRIRERLGEAFRALIHIAGRWQLDPTPAMRLSSMWGALWDRYPDPQDAGTHYEAVLREFALDREEFDRMHAGMVKRLYAIANAHEERRASVPRAGEPADRTAVEDLRAEVAMLGGTERDVLRALLKARAIGRGLTLRELMIEAKVNTQSTIERSINALEARGLEIPNPKNGAGFTLPGRSLRVAEELARIDAETTRKRR